MEALLGEFSVDERINRAEICERFHRFEAPMVALVLQLHQVDTIGPDGTLIDPRD